MVENWQKFGDTVNSAFYFVVNKIIFLQNYFIDTAYGVGRLVLLIALLSAGLNYVLTGSGLKENLIKIMKATVFFLIVIAAYPKIIGWITSYTYDLAYDSVGGSVKKYFDGKTETVKIVVEETAGQQNYRTLANRVFKSTPELSKLFNSLTQTSSVTVNKTTLNYKSVAPAAALQILLLVANNAFDFADGKKTVKLGPVDVNMPDFSRILKGLICGFFLILTGVFAVLEYLVCLMEFMLVASVGIILFPLSIWEGSKFMSEKFIGAIVGFFMKLLFCNIAIFLLLYGFISMFHILEAQGFTGSPDQFAFIIFTCLLFFYVCKSAPGIAQSLLTGAPSLSASGAISAATGAVAAAAAIGGAAQKAVGGAAKVGGAVAGGIARTGGGAVASFAEANAAKTAAMQNVAAAGGTSQQVKEAGNRAFVSSVMNDVGDSFKSAGLGLARSISGDKRGGSSGGGNGGFNNPHSWRSDFLNKNQTIKDHLDDRKSEGVIRGKASAAKYKTSHGLP